MKQGLTYIILCKHIRVFLTKVLVLPAGLPIGPSPDYVSKLVVSPSRAELQRPLLDGRIPRQCAIDICTRL